MRPGAGLIGRLTGQSDLASTLGLALGQSLTKQWGGNDRQAAIGNYADGVGQPVRLTPGVQPRPGKTAIRAEFDSDLWPRGPQTLDQAAKDQHNEARFVTPARTENGGDELVGLAIEHQQWISAESLTSGC